MNDQSMSSNNRSLFTIRLLVAVTAMLGAVPAAAQLLGIGRRRNGHLDACPENACLDGDQWFR